MPDRSVWTQTLRNIATSPLEFCQDFPTITRRFEAWWANDVLDRPVFIGSANCDPSRPISTRLDLLEHPDVWFDANFRNMRQLHRVGDALPWIRPNFGPALLGGMFGGRLDFNFDSDTGWTHPIIDDDWSRVPEWTIHPGNHWLRKMKELTELVAEQAIGRFLVCTTSLGGSGDILLNLRGSSQVCMDIVERPSAIAAAVDAIFHAWHQTYAQQYRWIVGKGAGIVHWLGIWSSQPYIISECDLNAMIGPQHFDSLFLPDIVRRAATAGRAVFHLDGTDAARHIDALFEVPEMHAIQFTPGAGSPSALAWLKMFRKIQQRGKSLLIICPLDEVLALCDELSPQGLGFLIDGSPEPEELDSEFVRFCRFFGN